MRLFVGSPNLGGVKIWAEGEGTLCLWEKVRYDCIIEAQARRKECRQTPYPVSFLGFQPTKAHSLGEDTAARASSLLHPHLQLKLGSLADLLGGDNSMLDASAAADVSMVSVLLFTVTFHANLLTI